MTSGLLRSLAFALAAWAAPSSAADEAVVTLPSGTEIRLETITPLSSKTSVKGDLVALRTAEDVRVGDRIVIPKGLEATGQIADARATGGMGMSGKLLVRPLFLRLDDQTVRLTGSVSEKPDVAAETVAGMVLVSPLLSGRSAAIPAGTLIIGQVERSVPVRARHALEGEAIDAP